ncbi:MAG: type IIA DNA topoisomerase subunit B [Deltaproteobacteria bacterium]|nr:type IIA DNA topoisomerase subunit B [Deltaproteobacteria bacterium]
MAEYTAKDIEVLEGLEPVRKRPAMYIGGVDSRGYHHLLWEVVDNSVDEAINGHATKIEVILDKDYRGATVNDDGRGIPVDVHAKYKRSALELIMCTLHAGGKFGGKSYQVAGGLHGVGISVVNALSSELSATVRRNGREYQQSYARGNPVSRLKQQGQARAHGTAIHYRPDTEIFGSSIRFDPEIVRERLEAKSYLHKGLQLVFVDQATGERVTYSHPGGIADYLIKLVQQKAKRAVHENAFTLERVNGQTRLEIALQWTEATDETIRSFANGIPTSSGGAHEAGFKQGLGKAVRGYMTAKNLSPKGVTIAAEDIREGVTAIVSIYVTEPQFQGQTKDRLNNPEVVGLVESALRTALEQWLLENATVADGIIARIISAARAREASRAAVQQVQRKTAISHRLNLPGKLADCSSTDPGECELFLVEGDSAGGNAKQGRNRRTQAILPLRGKVLNAERANAAAILANKELQDLVSGLGCGVGKDFNLSKLRYSKIFLLMDADSDGHHISTLLLTFFYRHLPGLLRNGHVFLALPPLYRIDVGKESYWALDDGEKDAILKRLPKNQKPNISRFKGLGEMSADELKQTTLDPKRRKALRVVIDSEVETDRVMNELMGKEPALRYKFIMDSAQHAKVEDLDV